MLISPSLSFISFEDFYQ